MDLKLISYKNEDCTEIIQGYNELPESVRGLISHIIADKLNEMVGRAESCQTPIEQLLGIALERQMDIVLPFHTRDFFINAQEILEVDDKKYRVDFFVVVRFKGKHYGFVIECDGHEFHEKTKEQAKKDRKRDRDLMSKGYLVIRFTGSEIVENPFVCAREAVNLIITHLEQKEV